MSYTVLGLLYDIAGVLMLAISVVTTRRIDIVKQSGAYHAGNRALFLTLTVQVYDARWGLALIVVGFAGQILGALGNVPSRNTYQMIIAGLVWLIAAYFGIRLWVMAQPADNRLSIAGLLDQIGAHEWNRD